MGKKRLKIAVIQTAFPGDVILSTPIFTALIDKYRNCIITAVVRPESEIILRNNPHIDNIIVYDKYDNDKGLRGIIRISRKLRGNDQAIIIQRHLRSALISFLAGIKKRIGYDNAGCRSLYTVKIPYSKNKHEVERVLDLISVDNNEKSYKPNISIDQKTISETDNLLEQITGKSKFAVLCPGSVWPTKRYPYYDQLAQLIKDEFDIPILLIGGKDDFNLFEEIRKKADIPIKNIAGKTNLLQSAEIISRAKFVVANDSAPAHIAAAVGTPVVAIFGPTTEKFGFGPYSEKSMVIDIGMLDCRPCSNHGSETCPEIHFKCMMELKPELILDAIDSIFL
jgi:heptosyltransferase-2